MRGTLITLRFIRAPQDEFKRKISMEKIDYKKELIHLYKPSAKKVEIVEVPLMNFLMVDGEGDPNTS